MEKKVSTIHDVAADADVSIATVSRVLNEPWRVLPATKARVTNSIAKLGYTPNIRARLLAKGDSGTICFLLCNRPFVHSVHALVLQGASAKADVMGAQVVYAQCNYSPDTPPDKIALPRMLSAGGLIDGIVLAGTNYPNMIQALNQLGVPYVVYGTNYISPDHKLLNNAIYVDGERGGYLAARHLLAMGHTKIRYIGDIRMPWYSRRYNGFCKALEEAGLPCPPAIGINTDGEMAMGFNSTMELMDAGEEFTGLFVAGDSGALGAMRAVRRRGMSVPADVSVVGFNDEELARLTDPLLTTVRGSNEEAGMRSVELLREIIDGTREDEGPVIMPVQLIVRESTAPPRSK